MKLRNLLIAGAIVFGATSPALAADWDKIDSITVSRGADRDSVSPDFAGPVEQIRLVAREGDVQCRRVTAQFGNGSTATLFHGRIARGQSRVLDLPGTRRTIDKLNFRCHGVGGDARIVIEANIGQYRSVWMKSPHWSYWAPLFGNWDQAVNYWVYLGHQTFTGRNDVSATFAGWAGRSVNSVGLKPVNDDARCQVALATFANGHTSQLNINGGDLLREDRTYRVDLPGGDRNLKSLILKCHAEHGRSVTLNIYANK